MSLHRVASLETFTTVSTSNLGSGSRRGSDASTRARKLTFNPLPPEWDPLSSAEGSESVGAFRVPQWKRLLQVAVSVIYCFLAAGIVFGYAAIKPVLMAEGAYKDRCSMQDESAVDEETCVEMHLNLMFTTAAVLTNLVALPIGNLLDHYGPRLCGLLGSLCLTIGALLLTFQNSVPFDGLFWGYCSLALGGPFVFISSFHLSNAFPRHTGLILALLTGAFDASSILFLVYRLIYQATNRSFSPQQFFLVYLVVPAAIAVLQLTLMPAQSYKTTGQLVQESEEQAVAVVEEDPGPYDDQVTEETALLREEERQNRVNVIEGIEEVLGSASTNKQTQREELANMRSGVWGVMHTRTLWQQIFSPWWILICLFTVVQMTRINYFLSTIRAQYESLLGSHDAAVALNNFFDVALPLGGILSIPLIGAVIDRTSTLTVLTSLVTCATALGVLGVIRNSLPAAYAHVALFVVFRPFYYTAVQDYVAKVFGFRTFGTTYGGIICLSGLLNFSQSGLDYLFERTFEGDPVPVNMLLLVLQLGVGIGLLAFVASRAEGGRGMLEREARRAVGREVESV